MNYTRLLVIIVEFICVALLSLCGIVAFSNSGMYSGFANAVAKYIPSAYLSLCLFLVLFGCGTFFIIIRNKGGGFLAAAVTILSLPSILSYDKIDLLKIFGGASHITTKLSLYQMISIGSLIITLYFLIDLVNQMKHDVSHLKARQAPAADLQGLTYQQFLLSAIICGGALLVSLAITGVARGFEYFFSRGLFTISWWLVPVSLFCIFVLGIYLYWVTTRKNT